MSGQLAVNISDLRVALSRALDGAEAQLGPEVLLDVDHYWHVAVADAFDMTSEPRSFTVGQVSDDLAEGVQDDHPRVPEESPHDLPHLIGVLRALEFAARS